MAANPWFSDWNFELLRIFFRLLPHNTVTDELCKMLLLTPLLSTWVFAACFYQFWTKDDAQRVLRRHYLVKGVVAFGIAGIATIILRPWIHWPAPALNPQFQPLFPHDLWGNGSYNCFPSHSTLAYFTISASFWPIHRRLSVWLCGMTLLVVSLPRVYAGGHYPIDVLFSCFLAILVLMAVWQWPISDNFSNSPATQHLTGTLQNFIFFLWVFELGEGFHSAELLVSLARRAFLLR